MNKFAIITESCADLTKELRQKYDIDYVNMRYIYDDNDVPASLDWEYMPYRDFYDLMRNGTRVKTAQVPNADYEEKFTAYLEKGYDILSISCSSALSSLSQRTSSALPSLVMPYTLLFGRASCSTFEETTQPISSILSSSR